MSRTTTVSLKSLSWHELNWITNKLSTFRAYTLFCLHKTYVLTKKKKIRQRKGERIRIFVDSQQQWQNSFMNFWKSKCVVHELRETETKPNSKCISKMKYYTPFAVRLVKLTCMKRKTPRKICDTNLNSLNLIFDPIFAAPEKCHD